MSNMPQVAVVILNWNGRALLEQFLPSVLASTYPNIVIYLADNASTDDSIEFVKSHYPDIKIIALTENWGFAEGYNQALQQVEAEYYVLLNSDVEVTPNWIEPIVEEMEKNKSIGAAQPKILAQRQKTHFEYAGAAGGFIDNLGYSFCRGRIFEEVEKDEGQYNQPLEICWASGCALFIRSELYHGLGGLDKDFFAHFEEIDLCWRVWRLGYSVMVFPDSAVYHVGGATLSASNPRKTYLNFRNNLVFLLKNNTIPGFLVVYIFRFILDRVAALRFLIGGKSKDAFAILKAHFHFLTGIRKWLKNRKIHNEKIQQLRRKDANMYPPIHQKSIIFQHYIQKNKTFDKL